MDMDAKTTSQMIAAADARPRCREILDVEERLRAAMRVTFNHYMETNEMGQVRAAVAASMLESPENERERIARSFQALNDLNNLMAAIHAGVPVNIDQVKEPPDDCIPILSIWQSVKSELSR